MDDQEYRTAQLRMRAEFQRHLLHVARWDAWMRMVLAVILVLGLFIVVGVGVVNDRTADQLSPLVAPLAGLAGLAVGHFFSQRPAGNPSLDEPKE